MVLVLVLAFRMITTGALVPRSVHEDLRADRDHWRAAAELDRQRMDAQSVQMTAILETSATTMRYAEAVQKVAAEGSDDPS